MAERFAPKTSSGRRCFRRIAGDGDVVQIDRNHVAKFSRPQGAALHAQCLRAVDRCAVEETRCNCVSADLVEHCPLLLRQAEMVVQLPGILQRIDLRLTIGAKRVTHAGLS